MIKIAEGVMTAMKREPKLAFSAGQDGRILPEMRRIIACMVLGDKKARPREAFAEKSVQEIGSDE